MKIFRFDRYTKNTDCLNLVFDFKQRLTFKQFERTYLCQLCSINVKYLCSF